MSDSNSPSNFNPMLLNPMNAGQQSAPAQIRMTQAYPLRFVEDAEYFKCSMLNHHMHRPDGKRLAFMFGILETKDAFDIEYLHGEVNSGNPYLSIPTEAEVHLYKMRTDPTGTMSKKITPEIESRVRAELEISLRKEFEERLTRVGVALTEEQMAAFQAPLEVPEIKATDTSQPDPAKLSGTDALAKLKAGFGGSLKTDTATLSMVPGSGYSGSAQTLQQSSIQGSDKTTVGAPNIEDTKSDV